MYASCAFGFVMHTQAHDLNRNCGSRIQSCSLLDILVHLEWLDLQGTDAASMDASRRHFAMPPICIHICMYIYIYVCVNIWWRTYNGCK